MGISWRAMDGLWADFTASMRRAEYREWTPHMRKRERSYPNYRFRLIEGGSGQLSVDARQYSVGAGDVLILQPGARHGGTTDPEAPIRSYWLSGTVRVRGTAVLDALVGLPTLMHPRGEVFDELVREAEVMVREVKERRVAHVLHTNAAFTRMLGLLWREAAETGVLAQPWAQPLGYALGEQGWLRPALAFMAGHYAEPVTLDQLAGVAHLSRAHFSVAFRRETGFTPFEYLRRVGMQRAKELLEAGATVAEAAAGAGFADPSYFGRVFRRAEGQPPSGLKRSKRNPDSA